MQNFSDVSEIAILLIIFVFPGLPCIIAHTSELFPLADFGRWPCRLCVSRSPRRSWQLSLLTHQLCLRLGLTCRSQTRKRAGAAASTPERAVTADASHNSTTGGVAVHDIVKAVMAEMAPLFERTIKAAVATAIEAMLPQLEASIVAENERLSKEVGHLRSALQSQAFELDRLAQYSRRENVRLHGIPETADENTNDVVITLASDMGVHIDEHNICISHRLQKSRSMQERPIIVRFVRRDTKTDMMRKKKTLRTIDRYRNPLRSKMLRALKHDEEVEHVWTIDGSFHCIVMEGNVEVKKRLDSPDDLFKLGWSEQKMENSGLFSHH